MVAWNTWSPGSPLQDSHKPDVPRHVCNSRTGEEEIRRSDIWGYDWLYRKFKHILRYVRLGLRKLQLHEKIKICSSTELLPQWGEFSWNWSLIGIPSFAKNLQWRSELGILKHVTLKIIFWMSGFFIFYIVNSKAWIHLPTSPTIFYSNEYTIHKSWCPYIDTFLITILNWQSKSNFEQKAGYRIKWGALSPTSLYRTTVL